MRFLYMKIAGCAMAVPASVFFFESVLIDENSKQRFNGRVKKLLARNRMSF
jgi:hypothetical protein